MFYRVLADLVFVVHLLFILFVLFGAPLALRWRWIPWLHVPAATWAALLSFFGWPCPLTPLEQRLRALAGQQAYEGGFIDHYIVPILYPGALSRTDQIILGLAVVAINAAAYAWIFRRRQADRR